MKQKSETGIDTDTDTETEQRIFEMKRNGNE